MKDYEQYRQHLRKLGFTDYDIKTKWEIYGSFIKFSLMTESRLAIGKELQYHLKDDHLSSDEWELFVEEKWHNAGISLSVEAN